MILVTGASGLLGFHLVKHLRAQHPEQQLRVLVRSKEHANRFREMDCQPVMGDILDVSSLEEALRDVDYVFHCAAVVSFSPRDEEKMHEVNVTGTANVVNLCLDFGIKKLCHVSSVAALGGAGKREVLDETVKWEENDGSSYYGYTKYLAELEVWRAHAEGLDVVVVNPSVILGPMKDWGQSSMKLFKYVKDGRSFYTEGRNNFVDVRDVSQLMDTLTFSDTSGERFVIAGYDTSFKQFFEEIANGLGMPAPDKKAKPWMIRLIYWWQTFLYIVLRVEPVVTKETIKIAQRRHRYSSEKVKEKTGITFRPLQESVEWICGALKSPSDLI